MSKRIKTLKGWEKSGVDLDKYVLPLDEIDESLYMYYGEAVAPEYCLHGLHQLGECSYDKDGIRYHDTAQRINNKYYYLGCLPSFNGPDR